MCSLNEGRCFPQSGQRYVAGFRFCAGRTAHQRGFVSLRSLTPSIRSPSGGELGHRRWRAVAELSDTRQGMRRFFIRAMSRTHGGIYRIGGGRLLGRVAGMPVLLLTTTGRRSGKPRTAALTYFRKGRDFVVIGSFGGSDLPPAWWLNLQHEPRANVLIGRTTFKVTARSASAEEHNRLWPLITRNHRAYARYQERTTRPIPIVLLTPEKE